MTKVNGNRKLPPYDELFDLVVNKRISYTDVAAKYGVHFSAVSSTLKRDRVRLGLPWPIETDKGARISKSLADIMVDATVIRDLLREVYQDRQTTFVPDKVLVSARSVNDPEHRDRRRYHLDGCYLNDRMGAETMLRVERATAEANRYQPCGTCCKLSVAEWTKELGLSISAAHMHRLVSFADDPNVRRIRKSTAVKILRAIGEEPHEVLSGWKSKKTAITLKPRRHADDQFAA